jgi:hypothetical protein
MNIHITTFSVLHGIEFHPQPCQHYHHQHSHTFGLHLNHKIIDGVPVPLGTYIATELTSGFKLSATESPDLTTTRQLLQQLLDSKGAAATDRCVCRAHTLIHQWKTRQEETPTHI